MFFCLLRSQCVFGYYSWLRNSIFSRPASLVNSWQLRVLSVFLVDKCFDQPKNIGLFFNVPSRVDRGINIAIFLNQTRWGEELMVEFKGLLYQLRLRFCGVLTLCVASGVRAVLRSVHTFSWFLKSNWSSDFGHAETGSGAKKRAVLRSKNF